MLSVTQRISQIKQPRGGYVNPRIFLQYPLETINELNQEENIHPSLMGIVVDYLTRFMLGADAEDAFHISLLGAMKIGEMHLAMDLISNVKGLDDASVISACRLSGFDVCFRKGIEWYKPVELIDPDSDTIENIRIMVNRSLKFFEKYGPITKDGFTFEGAYTHIVSTGDGDFLTKDTLWDFKVSKAKPTSKHTLQLLMYFIMGKKSVHPEFNSVKKLGIFNPRLNVVYQLDVGEIDSEVIDIVSDEIIGY